MKYLSFLNDFPQFNFALGYYFEIIFYGWYSSFNQCCFLSNLWEIYRSSLNLLSWYLGNAYWTILTFFLTLCFPTFLFALSQYHVPYWRDKDCWSSSNWRCFHLNNLRCQFLEFSFQKIVSSLFFFQLFRSVMIIPFDSNWKLMFIAMMYVFKGIVQYCQSWPRKCSVCLFTSILLIDWHLPPL